MLFEPSGAMLAHARRSSPPDSLGLPSSPPHRSRTPHRSWPLAARWVGCLASRCRGRDTDVRRSPWSLLPDGPQRRPRTAPGAVQSRGGTGRIAASGARGRGAHSVAGTTSGDEHAVPAQPRASPADLPRSRLRSRGLPSASWENYSRGCAGRVSDAWNCGERESDCLSRGLQSQLRSSPSMVRPA